MTGPHQRRTHSLRSTEAANLGLRKKVELSCILRASRITEIRPTHLSGRHSARDLPQSFVASPKFSDSPNFPAPRTKYRTCRFRIRRSFNTQRSKFCGLRRPLRIVDRLFRSALSHRIHIELSKKEKARKNADNVARTRGGTKYRFRAIESSVRQGRQWKSRRLASYPAMV